MNSIFKKAVSVAVICLLFGFASVASATTLGFIDVDTPIGTGNNINYEFIYNSVGGNEYIGTLNISNSANVSPEWYVGWVTINFGSNNPTISNLTYSGTGGEWSILTPTTRVVQGGTYVRPIQGNPGNFTNAGFYTTSITAPLPNPIINGVLVTGTTQASFSFNFTVTGLSQEMPFQVGYYNARTNGNAQFQGRLSETLGVPEPGTLLLLGSGLLGLGLMRRRKTNL